MSNEVRLEEFLKTLVEMMQIRAQIQGIAFLFDRPAELPEYICTDEKRLRQVLLNLLGNAIKFTKQGTVTLRTANGDSSSGARLRFEVEDTGIGITEHEAQHIFLPFQQAGEHQMKVQGTGLGLAISQRIVRLMGGEIRLSSTLGKGQPFLV